MVMVIDASGRREKFDPKKIYRTSVRAGASRRLANEVVEHVSRQVYDGISTRKILQMVLDTLRECQAENVASRYDLKSAIMRMGPEGFPFETFLSKILSNYGYECRLRQRIQGFCVEHEIDIVLEKDGKRSMVEVKFHNAAGIYTGLKEALYTYARFLDLKQGHEKGLCESFDGAWLATNTRASLEARRYASCKGIRLLGWKYPPRRGLEKMIEEKKLYPTTVIQNMDERSFEALEDQGIVLLRDLAVSAPSKLAKSTGLDQDRVEGLVRQAKKVISNPLLGGQAEA